jgi:internalin A
MPNLIEIDFSQNLIKELNFHASFEFNQTNLTKLDFHFNQIKSISSEFFTKFPNLIQLDLSFNKLQSLKTTFFANLNTLQVLNLSTNQIFSIEKNSFAFLGTLIYLNLRNNLIYDLSGDLFRNLSNLSELNLSQNKIEFISKDHFIGLSSLKVFDLSENMLKSLSRDSFDLVSSTLGSLILKLNRIQTNGDFTYNLKRLNFLDLSSNNIVNLHLNSTNSTITQLDLSNNNLSKNQIWNFFDNLTILNLSKTNVDLILSLNFSTKSKMEELDLSFNNLIVLPINYLANLKNLKKLNLKETNLIEFNILKSVWQLIYADLSNNKLSDQALLEFQLSNSLKVLKMSNCSLSSFRYIERLLYSNNVYLNYLVINSNNLNFLESINKCWEISHLDISDNHFGFLFSDNVVISEFLDNYGV